MSTTSSNKENKVARGSIKSSSSFGKRNSKGNFKKDSGYYEPRSESESSDSDMETAKKGRVRGSSSESDDATDDSSSSSSSEFSDCMEPIVVRKKKKIKRTSTESVVNDADSYYSKDTLPVSPAPSDMSNETSLVKYAKREKDGSESPETPPGQWEIERILDYVKDDFGDQYFVKWKDWEECYNTWEPRHNLVNCNEELVRFRRERKQQAQDALNQSKFEVRSNGRRRRIGPKIPDIPPDPRSLDEISEEFFEVNKCSPDTEEILNIFNRWKEKQIKARLSMPKVLKFLDDGIDRKLSKSDMSLLKQELVVLQVEKKAKKLESEIWGWEKQINAITGGRPYITIENKVDLQGPTIGFQFVNDYVPGEGVVIPKDPPVGCSCGTGATSCYDSRSSCCASAFDYKYAYTKYGKVNVLQGSPIYECNSKCECGPECPNRVVQDGKSDHKFCIFRTDDGRGWGVKTLKSIKKGSFVTLYVGEVIKSEEANRRGKIYDKIGCTYLFDLDFNDAENYPFSVDASKYGNVAHYINHSCMPNLGVYNVWTDCLDPNLPKLALFALKDIGRNEELTFDYSIQLNPESRSKTQEDDNKSKRVACLCGTPKCRKFIF